MKTFIPLSLAALAAIVSLLSVATPAQACTGIRLQAKNGAIVYARTLEFGSNLESNILVVPRNFSFQGTTTSGKRGLEWKSKFGAVGLNGLGKTALVDGVNEKGLASGIFYLPGYAEYQSVSEDEISRSIAPWELVTWILTNFSTTDEVRAALPAIKVGSVAIDNYIFPLHYVVHDATGHSLVIEYLAGQLTVRDNPIGVITNAPDFDWHIKNLNNYVNLTPDNANPETISGLTLSQLGQGSGMLGLPGDFTPPSRFVRATVLGHSARAGANGEQTVREAFHVLDSFDIPLGTVRPTGHDATYDEYTQWTCASDTKNLAFYFHTYDNRRVRRVELSKFDLDAKVPMIIRDHAQEDFEDLAAEKIGG